MGLDIVELVISIEQHFGVEIPNSDAERLYTPRAVIDYLTLRLVDQEVVAGESVPCGTQQAFYRVRQVLETRAGVLRASIVPDRPLADLILRRNRARVWAELRGHVISGAVAPSVLWPNLKRPAWLTRILVAASGGVFLLLLGHGISSFGPGLGVGWAAGAAVIFTFVMERLTIPWRTEFSPVNLTVGDLARIVGAHNALNRSKPNVWTRERIAQDVRALVMSELGLSTITDDARFVEDLRVD